MIGAVSADADVHFREGDAVVEESAQGADEGNRPLVRPTDGNVVLDHRDAQLLVDLVQPLATGVEEGGSYRKPAWPSRLAKTRGRRQPTKSNRPGGQRRTARNRFMPVHGPRWQENRRVHGLFIVKAVAQPPDHAIKGGPAAAVTLAPLSECLRTGQPPEVSQNLSTRTHGRHAARETDAG